MGKGDAKGDKFRLNLNLLKERNLRRNTVVVGKEFGIEDG